MRESDERLAEDLVLRPVETDEDVARFAAFLGTINLVEGTTAGNLLRAHPAVSRGDFLAIADAASGEQVSSSCLIPWPMRCAGVELSCLQVEMILTHPSYRKRGLVRAQFRKLHELADRRQADVVIIWGIPYYYRQFGYGYALDGSAFQSLPAYRIEDGRTATEAGYRLRPGRPEDIPALSALYEKSMAGLDVHLARPAGYWKYLLGAARFPLFVLEAAGGKAAGYSIHLSYKGTTHVLESGIPDAELAMGFLRELKKDAREIQVNWPRTQTLTRLAEGLGSVPVKTGQWLIRLPDVARLLDRMRPVLDRRLAASEYAAADVDFVLNLFRSGVRLRIRGGKVASVEEAGFVDASMGADGGNLNIPPDAFIRLFFGQSGVDELLDAWPDIVCRPADRPLVDTLFPRMSSYLYTPYHYYGPELYTLEEKHARFYV
jgi:hypothetical protein